MMSTGTVKEKPIIAYATVGAREPDRHLYTLDVLL